MRPARLGPFGYPLAGEQRERPLLACWLLCLLAFPVPVLPAVPVVGYLVRVLEATQTGASAPPFLADPFDLVRQSVGGVAVALAYLAVPVGALLVTVFGVLSDSRSALPGFGGTATIYAGGTVVFTLFLLATYLLPVALAAYARSRSLRRAFASADLRPVAAHAAYFTRWMAGLVALSLTASLANLLSAVPRLGPVLAAFVLAYGSVLAFHAWGRAVAVARERRSRR